MGTPRGVFHPQHVAFRDLSWALGFVCTKRHVRSGLRTHERADLAREQSVEQSNGGVDE